jgi:hypothetical protein
LQNRHRVVIKNNKDEKGKLKPFRHVNILFLLSSEYLNKRVNDARDDFAIHPKQRGGLFVYKQIMNFLFKSGFAGHSF